MVSWTYATPNEALGFFDCIFRDQEVGGSNPLAPTNPFTVRPGDMGNTWSNNLPHKVAEELRSPSAWCKTQELYTPNAFAAPSVFPFHPDCSAIIPYAVSTQKLEAPLFFDQFEFHPCSMLRGIAVCC